MASMIINGTDPIEMADIRSTVRDAIAQRFENRAAACDDLKEHYSSRGQ